MKKPIMPEGKMVQKKKKKEQFFEDKICLKTKLDLFKIKLFNSRAQWLLI